MQISQMSRINTNNCVFHSEHSEESREGKGKEIHRSALNDKLVVNGYAWYTVSERRGTSPFFPLQRGEEISITFLLFFSATVGLPYAVYDLTSFARFKLFYKRLLLPSCLSDP